MKTRVSLIRRAALTLLVLSTFNPQLSTVFAQGTAFTYQGRLDQNGAPASGLYDLRFKLFVDPFGNTQTGSAVVSNAVSVASGLFTVSLDFGAGIFNGSNFWLEVDVKTNAAGFYVDLNPLQALTPAPYAIFAAKSGAGGLAAGTYGSAVAFNNPADQFTGAFTGNGANLTNVNAATLGGLSAANFWKTGGNSGTSPTNGNFIGTTDNQPLELKVSGRRALRLEPNTNGSANVIGGWSNNFVSAIAAQATIGGGGGQSAVSAALFTNIVSDSYGTVAGGLGNIAGNLNDDPTDARGATVGGGAANQAGGFFSTVAGGQANQAGGVFSTVAGGHNNTNGSEYASIGGGDSNTIQTNSVDSVIGGGLLNSIDDWRATIAGGSANHILSNAAYSAIGGGGSNVITNSAAGTIGGGGGNSITNSNNSTIGGGAVNSIQSSLGFSTIGGGRYNTVSGSYGTIPGGSSNSVSGINATVAGGTGNLAGGINSFAAGNGARALHDDSFVWSDGSSGTFSSTASSQFLIRAAGGVGIGTASPQTALHVLAPQGSQLRLQDTASNFSWNIYTESATGNLLFVSDSTAYAWFSRLDGAVFHSSDARLKKDITLLGSVLDRVLQLRPVAYHFRSAPKEAPRTFGLIAQEVESLFPEVVGEHEGMKGLAYGELVPVTIRAVQELNQKLTDELQRRDAENADLKHRLDKLEQLLSSKN